MESDHQIVQIKTEAHEDYSNQQQVYPEVGTNSNSGKSEITKHPVTNLSETENGYQQQTSPELLCLLCNTSYQNKNELKRHLKEKHSYKNFFSPEEMIQRNLDGLDTSPSIYFRYACQLCHAKFKTFKSFSTHTLSHRSKNRWIERMGMTGTLPLGEGLVRDFDERAAIQSHYMFTCTDCKAIFVSRDSYAMHRMMRTMNETCEPIGNQGPCFGTSFSQRSKPNIDRRGNLKQALNSGETNQRRLEDVTGEVDRDEYLNSILEKVVNTTLKSNDTGNWGFKSTGTSESDLLRVTCVLCGTYFVDQDSLAMHVMSVHTGEGMQNGSYRTDHRKMIAVPKKSPCLTTDKLSQFRCHICGEQCLSCDSLAMHVLSHSIEQQTPGLTTKRRKREGFPEPLVEHAKRMYTSARIDKESFVDPNEKLNITTSGKMPVRKVPLPRYSICNGDVNASEEEVCDREMSKPSTSNFNEKPESFCDLCSVHVLSQHEREKHKNCCPSSSKEKPLCVKKIGVQEAQVHVVDKDVFIMNSQRSNSCPIAEKSRDQCFVQERPCSAGPIAQFQSRSALERWPFLSRERGVMELTEKSVTNNDDAKSKDNSNNMELIPTDESQDDSDDPGGYSYIMDLSTREIRNTVARNLPIEMQDQTSITTKDIKLKPNEKLNGDEKTVCSGQGLKGMSNTPLVDLHLRGRSTSKEADIDSDSMDTSRNQGQSLMCKHCQIIFLQKAMYYLHMGLHNVNSPWQCNVCGKECSDAIDFTAHVIHM